MAGVNDINLENQIALDTLKRLGSMVTGGLRGLNQPPQAVAPNVYGTQPQPAPAVAPAAPTVSAKYQRGGGLPAAQPTATPVSADGITQTMEGGLRRTANGAGTTYEQGTPGQDGYGKMLVAPSRGNVPMSAEESRFRAPIGTGGGGMRATGRMIQAISPDYSFLKSSAPAQGGPIDFANMSRQERRFALRNAQLSQEQQKMDNAYDLGLRTISASRDNAQVREQETPAQLGLRQAQAQEAGARSALLTEQAKIAGNEKFITTFEETPYTDPATGLTEMRRSPILVNPANPQEVIRPGQKTAKAITEADFNAALDADPARRKAFSRKSPKEQEALRAKYLQAGAM